ncbi:Uncharacterised protein [Enterobacter hormaechei]|uniref:hypothetical protein n=1 Tax=Enterobacter hormaechei TaxID=158836 RepID=UPI000799DBD3|nr:hypothetical protein [Enterobacter hormaechei]SAB27055.1 Uncharacterised protein [Enterobacter hormaechei]
MITLTKEWLLKTIAELEEERDATPGAVNEDAAKALAAMKIALASLEAEKGAQPVAKVETVGVCWYADNGVPRKPAVGTELFAAPPAPIVTVRELTMWVKWLAHSLRNAKSGSKLPDDAMAYLSAKGLIGVEDALR